MYYTKQHCIRCGMIVERQFYGGPNDARNLQRWCDYCVIMRSPNQYTNDVNKIIQALMNTVEQQNKEIKALVEVKRLIAPETE